MAISMTDAMAEAYAAAPAEAVVLETLELRHPALVDDADNPAPIRVVVDHRDWTLTLEDDAPLNGGEAVIFRHLQLKVDLIDSSDAPPAAKVTLDTVDQSLIATLEQAVTIRAPIEVTYRSYLAPAPGDETAPEPGQVIEGLKLRHAQADNWRMTGAVTFDNLANKASGMTYTRTYFGGLAR